MAVFTKEQIHKRMTELVRKYIDMGYYIYISAMGSSQSHCLGRVVLHNGIDFINIHLDNHITFNVAAGEHNRLDMSYLALVEESTGNEVPFWNNSGTVISSELFYEVGKRKKAYVNTSEEWEEAMIKTCNRMHATNWGEGWTNRRELRFNPEAVIQIVRRRPGYKSCRKSQIKCVARVNDGWRTFYKIIVEGKQGAIIIPLKNKKLVEY